MLSLKGMSKILLALREKEELSFSDLEKIVGFTSTTSRASKMFSGGVFDYPQSTDLAS